MSSDLRWGRRYLMCPPTHFDVTYAINPWMDIAIAVDRELAQRQWDALVQTYRDAGATIEVIEAQPGLPDMVFTANLGIVDGTTFIGARMRHPQRRPETAHAMRWFRDHGFGVRTLSEDVVQEGAGDALAFGDTLVAGHRARSSAGAYVDLARLVAGEILPLELADPRFYHVDIVFCPLDARTAMYAPTALDEDGARLLAKLVPDAIALTPDEAAAFCANSVAIGRTVVMPACSPRLERELGERGFEPVVVDVSEFLKAGGGPRCLTLALDVRLGEQDGAALAERYTAHNYHPLPVTVSHAEGAWVTDDRGRRHLDALSAYSALNFGHRHPKLVAAAREQLARVTLTSRAFSNDQLGPFARELAALCGKDRVLPMNTGAEAVETAIKVARKWGYEVKGVRPDRATILVCDGNFHGRTTTIVSFSDDPLARDGYGPFTPGFLRLPFGDAGALERALRADEDVVAFLVEPIQGESGVVIPPDGYLRDARRLCSEHGVLLIADEIQSGLGRTGRTFACDHDDVVPDVYVLGKALGGGILALSAIVADDDVLGVFGPGSHGSTFGGNPLACAVGRAVLELLAGGEPQANAARIGARLRARLDAAAPAAIAAIRSRGLWFGLDLGAGEGSARGACERLLEQGVLAKDTHEHTIRLAPPLTITDAEADWLLERLLAVLGDGRPLRLAPPVAAAPPRPASFAA
ncbi:MAG TPA: ornithine--oxo-acid transaminase [Solirubrobacteraceae bacterium]|jgi:ornithine--oxo-acid transaminase|nr:ornithine--oxo-acid transaminase [Solirubrobacteraceae bacterium]